MEEFINTLRLVSSLKMEFYTLIFVLLSASIQSFIATHESLGMFWRSFLIGLILILSIFMLYLLFRQEA